MAISREGIRVLSGPLWMALGAGFFACLVVGISAERTYSQAQVALLDAQQEQVRLVVQTSARLLDDRVRVDFESDSLGERSALALQSIRQLNQQIDAAYILTPVGKNLKVQNIAGKSPGIRKGVILDGVLPVARAVFEKGGSQVDLSSFERDGSSSLRSFAAVYRNGKIAGVLGIDYKSLKYVNRADSVGDTQRSGWLLAMLVGMLCSVAAYTVRFRQLREANNLKSAKLELEDSNTLLEDRVEQRTEELKHALSSKSLFLMSAGHELRTPLNGLMGMTTLALDTELSVEQREYFTHAKSSAIQLTQKINQLLDLAS
ncbi:MAG: histidine kinase dimerization/phospho-acceptor domain-containing protein, partial [Fimbriimonadaceae bacterium]